MKTDSLRMPIKENKIKDKVQLRIISNKKGNIIRRKNLKLNPSNVMDLHIKI